MLNAERVILMTEMAAYEEGEGRKNIAVGKFFRSDYLSMQMMKSVLCATISFGAIFALYVLYHLDTFMQDLYKMDLLAFVKQILIYYGVTLVVYLVISYIVYSYRYAKARKNVRQYYQNLKKLNDMY